MRKHIPSDLEERLSREVMARVEGKENTTTLQYAHKLVDDLMKPQYEMEFAKQQRNARISLWGARVLAVPFIIFSGSLWIFVILALVTGETHSPAKRQSHVIFSIFENPILFVTSLAANICIAGLASFITVLIIRETKWMSIR
ncbi:MAG: hypothetical protein Q7R66_00500 [Undibacterium sp.]|uniref:hypothetical protein n=1 Tax=Undibacterium sp. TaxID=1914977 RepID=UPI00271D2042|nr:hypothetical protein [Undibacterium sp.]MDO8650657.1 hypothetical protein [Undibacterium sp.]